MTRSAVRPEVCHCSPVPLHSRFLLLGMLSVSYVLSEISPTSCDATSSMKPSTTLLTQVPSKALGTNLRYSANPTLVQQLFYNY